MHRYNSYLLKLPKFDKNKNKNEKLIHIKLIKKSLKTEVNIENLKNFWRTGWFSGIDFGRHERIEPKKKNKQFIDKKNIWTLWTDIAALVVIATLEETATSRL